MAAKSVDEQLRELRKKQEAAVARARRARAAAGQLERAMRAASRRRETQLLCTLGRAWMSLGEQNPSFRTAGQRFLASYISRDTDRDILRATVWEIPEPSASEAAADAD